MKRVLVIAPHKDDEIIGVGGTIIRHIKSGDEVYVCIMTKGTEPLYRESFNEAVVKMTRMCHQKIGVTKTYFLDFPAAMLEKEDRYRINDALLKTIQEIKPDIVYIPHWGDMQKDHQIVADAAMVCLRPKYIPQPEKIYAYETLSETGWNVPNVQNAFIPNAFVDITEELDEKLEAMRYYESEISAFPNARSIEAIEALARYRGATMNMKAAEAFFLIREIITR